MLVKVLRICVTLWALFAASIASAADLSDLSEAERKAFGEEVKRYLMENPEVIFEAVDAFKAQQAASEAQNDFALVQQYSAALFDDGFSYQGGNLEGDITLVEFIDYRCGYCKKAFQDVKELLKADGNIRLILKELPILGEASVAAARYAVAVKQLYDADAYKRLTASKNKAAPPPYLLDGCLEKNARRQSCCIQTASALRARFLAGQRIYPLRHPRPTSPRRADQAGGVNRADPDQNHNPAQRGNHCTSLQSLRDPSKFCDRRRARVDRIALMCCRPSQASSFQSNNRHRRRSKFRETGWVAPKRTNDNTPAQPLTLAHPTKNGWALYP